MKKLATLLILFIFLGCSSRTDNPGGTNGEDSTGKGSTNPGTGESNKQKSDTSVYMGSFAWWNVNDDIHYEGNYDTASHIFIMCSNDSCYDVPPEHIAFKSASQCPAGPKGRFKVLRKLGGKFAVIGNGFTIIDSSDKNAKAIYYIGNERKVIYLKPHEIRRIKRSAICSGNLSPAAKTELVTPKDTTPVRINPAKTIFVRPVKKPEATRVAPRKNN